MYTTGKIDFTELVKSVHRTNKAMTKQKTKTTSVPGIKGRSVSRVMSLLPKMFKFQPKNQKTTTTKKKERERERHAKK